MQKSVKIILLLVVLMSFVLVVSNSVSAADPVPESPPVGSPNVPPVGDSAAGSGGFEKGGADEASWGECDYTKKPFEEMGFFEKRFCIWKAGQAGLDGNRQLVGDTLRYLVLILVIVLTYTSFTYVRFPENFILRSVMSVIVGFLATFLISGDELITALTSYSALAIAFTVFLPIAILAFFTMVVASKGDPIGIFVQKIVWVIYSVYLFFKTYVIWIIPKYLSSASIVDGKIHLEYLGNTVYLTKLPWYVRTVLPSASDSQKFVDSLNGLVAKGASSDATMTIVLLVTAVMVFVVMVLGNKYVDRWIEHQKVESAKEAYKMEQELAKSKAKIDADVMKGNKQV